MKLPRTPTRGLIAILLLVGALILACDDASVVVPDGHQDTSFLNPSHATGDVHDDTGGAEFNEHLSALRKTTAQFHNFEKAVAANYGTEVTPCWYHSEFGGQGYHYGNPNFIDGSVNLLEPELLMYEPGPAGQLRLVGTEYIVPVDTWEGEDPPSLLGQDFHLDEELGLYALHVWVWRHNPEGMFADWNPTVSCEHADEAENRS